MYELQACSTLTILLIKIERVGAIAKKRLNKNEIFTLGDLHRLNSNQELIVEIVKRTKGLTVQAITRFLENSKDLSGEDAPPTVFYCDDENPYAAKFGSEENEWGEPVWIEEIKNHRHLQIPSASPIW